MKRYGTSSFPLLRQPRPADRESRFPQPKDRSMHRPKEGSRHV